MTKKQFDGLKEGQLIVFKDGGEETVTAFNPRNVMKSLESYRHFGVAFHYTLIRLATEKDYKGLLKKENERHEKTIEYIESSWKLTKGEKQ